MVAPAICHAAGQFVQLRADHSRGEVRHAQVIKRKFVLPAGHSVRRHCVLHPGMFVGPRHDDAARDQVGIVRDQNTAFARVHHLVALEAEAPDAAKCTDVLPIPCGPEGVGSVFDHGHACSFGQGQDRIHVRCMAAHMADKHRVNAVELGGKIIQIDPVIVPAFNQDRNTVGVHNRRRDSSKGECGDQDAGPNRESQRLEGQEQGCRTTGHSKGVFAAQKRGKVVFQEGNRGVFGGCVAEQIAGTQQARDLGHCGIGDGFGGVDIRKACHVFRILKKTFSIG